MAYFLFWLKKKTIDFIVFLLPAKKKLSFRQKFQVGKDITVFLDQVDKFVPKPVLKAMSEFSNEHFIKENQKLANLALSAQASQGGGGFRKF